MRIFQLILIQPLYFVGLNNSFWWSNFTFCWTQNRLKDTLKEHLFSKDLFLESPSLFKLIKKAKERSNSWYFKKHSHNTHHYIAIKMVFNLFSKLYIQDIYFFLYSRLISIFLWIMTSTKILGKWPLMFLHIFIPTAEQGVLQTFATQLCLYLCALFIWNKAQY